MQYQVVWEENTKSHRVLQDTWGPCPLISIFNALLLRGSIRLSRQLVLISFQDMIDHIKSYFEIQLRQRNFRDADSQKTANDIKNFEDARKHFPSLEKGLDVNVKFSEPDAFEFTTELVIFDVYGIRLVHAWTVDPQETCLAFIRDQSYNELTSFILSESHEEGDDVERAIYEQRRRLAHDFLQDTSSQMTAHGLFRLHEVINEGEISVLFRNNHFATITKHNGEIYALSTDLGLVNDNRSRFWESLSTLDGDSVFLDSSFRSLESNVVDSANSAPASVDRDIQKFTSDVSARDQIYSPQQGAEEYYKEQHAKKTRSDAKKTRSNAKKIRSRKRRKSRKSCCNIM